MRVVGGSLAGFLLLGAGFAASSAPVGAALGSAKPVIIGVKGLSFDPKKVTAAPGATINFVWRQNVAHNIVFDDKSAPKAKTQNKGMWATKANAKPGTYKYKCTLHPGMAGEIIVK